MERNDTVLGIEGVPDELCDAYVANYAAYKTGMSQADVVAHYDKTAQGYEEMFQPDNTYNGHKHAFSAVDKYYGEHKIGIRILDGAAGTGLLGQLLWDAGFHDMDALDPSSSMLQLAETKKIYTKLICDALDDHRLTIEHDTYDVVVVAGAMGEGHIPCAGLLEMARITKPGGIVCIVMREEYLSHVEEYKDRLEPLIKEMTTHGIWTQEERTVISDYAFGKTGLVYVFRVQHKGCAEFTSLLLKK